MFKVMMTCPAGTIRLHDGTDGCYWETVMHTITWCNEPTLDAAMATATELMAGAKPGTVRAWVDYV